MNTKKWAMGWLISVAVILTCIGIFVYYMDPYIHYHKPHTDKYFYTLDNQRSMNDGITRLFDYDSVMTGTSMTENFRTTEMQEYLGVDAIKIPYSGGSLKEVNDNIRVALESNPDITSIYRALDFGQLMFDKDRMRTDLGEFPTYLYDDNPFNDVSYFFNKDVIFSRSYQMIKESKESDFVPGITSFDDYSSWRGDKRTYGAKEVIGDTEISNDFPEAEHMSEEEKQTVYDNIMQNVISVTKDYPDVQFVFFIPPYSIMQWYEYMTEGSALKRIEAEQYVIEMLFECDNVKVFSFDMCTDIITDLSNYYDIKHYSDWVNTYILECLSSDEHRLTQNNYLQYIDDEKAFYTSFDYESLLEQED